MAFDPQLLCTRDDEPTYASTSTVLVGLMDASRRPEMGLFTSRDVKKGEMLSRFAGAIVYCDKTSCAYDRTMRTSHIVRVPETDFGVDGLYVAEAVKAARNEHEMPKSGLGSLANSCRGTSRKANAKFCFSKPFWDKATDSIGFHVWITAITDIEEDTEVLLSYPLVG